MSAKQGHSWKRHSAVLWRAASRLWGLVLARHLHPGTASQGAVIEQQVNKGRQNAPIALTPSLLLCSALILLVLTVAHPAQAADTSLSMSSEQGDFIGQGRTYFFTPNDGPFNARRNFANGVSLSLFPTGTFWFLDFAAPQSAPLTPGSYFDARRFPFQDTSQPGLSVSGDGRGCNMLKGSFQVKQVVYGEGDAITQFWAVFEQHCEGASPALRGDVRFNADVVVAVNAPLTRTVQKEQSLTFGVTATEVTGSLVSLTAINLPPGALFTDNGDNTGTLTWTPGFDQAGVFDVTYQADNGRGGTDSVTTRITVTGVTSLLLDSEPGDFIGAGQLLFFTSPDGFFRASTNFDNGVSSGFSSSAH